MSNNSMTVTYDDVTKAKEIMERAQKENINASKDNASTPESMADYALSMNVMKFDKPHYFF